MTKTKNYKKTLIACYLGFITQGIPKTSGFIYQITHPVEVAGGAEKWNLPQYLSR